MEWDELPTIVDMEEASVRARRWCSTALPAISPTTPLVGDKAKTDAAFAAAPRKASLKVVNPRVVANYMEPRAARADIDKATGAITLGARQPGRARHPDRCSAT